MKKFVAFAVLFISLSANAEFVGPLEQDEYLSRTPACPLAMCIGGDDQGFKFRSECQNNLPASALDNRIYMVHSWPMCVCPCIPKYTAYPDPVKENQCGGAK